MAKQSRVSEEASGGRLLCSAASVLIAPQTEGPRPPQWHTMHFSVREGFTAPCLTDRPGVWQQSINHWREVQTHCCQSSLSPKGLCWDMARYQYSTQELIRTRGVLTANFSIFLFAILEIKHFIMPLQKSIKSWCGFVFWCIVCLL